MKPTNRYLGTLIAVLLALTTPIGTAQARTDPPDPDRPGFFPGECPVEVPKGYTIECGTVIVPEDHTRPDSPPIRLAVAIVYGREGRAAADEGAPMLFIDGGPGGRTLDSMDFWLEFINPLLAKHDLIFFDQRGTGYSEPALECPEVDLDPWATSPVEVLNVEAVTACRDRLVSQGIDLSAYNSAQNAGDIGVLREALGYEEWDLYGVSYGTRVALTVLRDHPQGVRSVILDAVTPIEADLLLDDPASARVALQKAFAACRADFVCRTVYPAPEQVYVDLVDDLAADPVTLEVVNSKTGESRAKVLDGLAFSSYVLGIFGMPQFSGVPGLIYEVRAGNYEPIIADLESAWESEEPDQELRATIGLQLAVICNEEVPFMTPERVADMLAAYPAHVDASAAFAELYYTMCQAWGVGPADPIENAPVSSDIPILILAGEYDAARPPVDARRAAEALSNSMVVEFPGAGHSVVYSAGACPLDVMGRFLDDPSATPDTSCVAEVEAPRFFVTITRTRPMARIAAILAGAAGLSILLYAGIGLGTLVNRRQVAWRVVLRRVGWRPAIISAVLSTAVYLLMPVIDLTYFYQRCLAQAIVIVGPLVMAIQTAFLVAPEDEPGLEMLLACPRPFHWLAIERVAIALVGQSLAALVVMAAGAGALGEHIPTAVGGWIASGLFLSGLAAFVSVRTRRAMPGVLVALLAWFVLGVAGSDQFDEVLLPAVPLGFHLAWPRPFDLIQPLVWMVHPFLRPDSLTRADFFLNRVIVGGLGLGLMALAMIRLADSERTLLGIRFRERASKGKPKIWPAGARGASRANTSEMPPSTRSKARATTARRRTSIGLAQVGAIMRYELLMSWRRGTLRTTLLSILLFPQVLYLVSYVFAPLVDEQTATSLVMWPKALLLVGTGAAISTNITTVIMIVLLLPLMLAELIPLDRQYRVREIIDALPITRNVYLAGKLLSIWPVVVISMVLSALLGGTLTWLQNGPYHVGTLAAFWLTGLIPLALLSSQMGVMFPAGQSSRRRAILMSLVAVAGSLAAFFLLPLGGFLFAALVRMSLTLEQLGDPSALAAIPGYPDALSLNTLLRIGGAIVIMAVIWLVSARERK
jgi:pimeloyl-ACP methyl ester carboxylesterase